MLDEFLVLHRPQVLALVTRKLQQDTPDRADDELLSDLPTFLDEVIGALRRDRGLPAESPLPSKSETAVRHGRQRHRAGFEIRAASMGFGMVCDAISECAMEHDVQMTVREFQLLNQCVDTAVADSITEYWAASRADQEQLTTKRIGFLVHELRNGMSVIQMAFKLLREGRIGLRSQTADAMDRNIKRMVDLIAQASATVQLQSGAPIRRERLQVRTLLEELQGSLAPERGVSLQVHASSNVEVCADPNLLSSALMNLVQNALKFTRTGGFVVARATENSTHATIEVQDECGGLPEGGAEELFVPFSQHGHDRSGLGLGLTITREAVAAHDGHIEVRNLPGKGCIFRVVIPRDPSRGAQ